MSDKILIADDSVVDRRFLSRILGKAGYEVLLAEDGEQATNVLLHERPNIVLLDIMMPKKDGYQVCAELKDDQQLQDIPVIFLSALGDTQRRVKGLELGAADYIAKPFHRNEVLVRVKNQLEIQKLTRSLLAANEALVEKQRRLDEDLRAAEEVQKSLIPTTPPDIPGVKIASLSSPCDTIGGDIFNVFPLDENNWGIFMVDVSGHGLSSAMVTVSVSQTLSVEHGNTVKRATSEPPYYEIPSPVTVLEELDRQYPIDRFDKFFTISYLVLNPHTRTVRYSSAAHPMPVIVRADGSLDSLPAGGTIIGLGGRIPFEEGESRIHPGDRLFVYTDGIVECTNTKNECYGEDRLYNILIDHRKDDLECSCEQVLQSVESFAGEDGPQDDVSLLALEFQETCCTDG